MNKNQTDADVKKCEFYKNLCKNGNNCQGIYETKIGDKIDKCIRYRDPKLMKQKNTGGYFK